VAAPRKQPRSAFLALPVVRAWIPATDGQENARCDHSGQVSE